jgi:AraC-like DNA-binding protein
MYKVGYDNRSTFYRNFKDIYDKTPREYREQMHRDMIRDLTK